MKKAWMIAEKAGPSIYETHTIGFVYLKKEWAEHQLNFLKRQAEEENLYSIVELVIREVQIVDEGP